MTSEMTRGVADVIASDIADELEIAQQARRAELDAGLLEQAGLYLAVLGVGLVAVAGRLRRIARSTRDVCRARALSPDISPAVHNGAGPVDEPERLGYSAALPTMIARDRVAELRETGFSPADPEPPASS